VYAGRVDLPVVLVASGSAAAQGVRESLTDLALGSSCLAAADGCH
jgi:hypothetical protein